MASSEARILANRANAAKSTGPRTPEGKGRSRRNGLKHGLTGQGIVVPEQDVEEIERRAEALEADLDPQSALGSILVRQMATLSVRMERGALQESAALATRVRHAAEEFDRARLDEADRLFGAIADDPGSHRLKLRRSPEGVDRLVLAWRELRAELTAQPRPTWTGSHLEKAANLIGLRGDDSRASRVAALSRATWGNFQGLAKHDGAGLGEDARQAWARDRLLERIDEEIAGLEAHRESFDLEAIALDRAEAGDRALFDPSKEAALARRYESEARRGFFKALKEFRHAEAEAAGQAATAPAPTPEVAPPDVPLGSSRERTSRATRDPEPIAPEPTIRRDWPVRDHSSVPLTIGRAAPTPG